MLTEKEMKGLYELDEIFKKHYRIVIKGIAKIINSVASHVPGHRERMLHTGLFGYSRGIEGTNLKLPRAIQFTAALYSLAVPPELIGTGRGLAEAEKKGLLPLLLKLYPGIRKDLIAVGNYLNMENVQHLLERDSKAFGLVLKDIELIEKFCKCSLGPKDTEYYLHRNYTSNIYHLWKSDKEILSDILKAAEIRRSLG